MTNVYPRESIEFQPVTVTIDGVAVTAAVKFAVTGTGERPTIWAEPAIVGAQIGVMVEGKTPGYYRVWAQVTSAPETPVIDCGSFQIT